MKGWRSYKALKTVGFTIVELLVVVTVIGIIAGIVVVSYNSARINAENAKTLQAANQYLKTITNYGVRNGTYPVTSTYPCLGTVASCAKVSGSTNCFGINGAISNASFNAIIAAEVSPVPEPSTQGITCSGNQYVGGYYNRNDSGNGKTAEINFFLRGNQTCPSDYGTVTKSQQDDLTRCRVVLPTLP